MDSGQTPSCRTLRCDCRICGQVSDHPCWSVREMQFGTRQPFEYFQCQACRCLQIAQVPENLADYYPSGYYSTRALDERKYQGVGGAFRLLPPRLAMRGLRRNPKHFAALHGWPLAQSCRVLDVGCGNGKSFAYPMKQLGYDVCGCDPFLPSDIHYQNGLSIYRRTLGEMGPLATGDTKSDDGGQGDRGDRGDRGGWDLLAFHHSFEHIANPSDTLKQVAALLTPDGLCLIRIPVASGQAWERYRTDWVQLDAPRHLFLHTPESMAILARQAGLKVIRSQGDSDYFQFWASENYQRDIPLKDQKKRRSWGWQLRRWRWNRLADRLNRQGLGDQAVFVLKRA